MSQWTTVCKLDDILPGTGVCALVEQQQIAVFRPRNDEQVYAISNIDPFAQASVLSRGIVGEHQDDLWVASPLKNSISAFMMASVWRMEPILLQLMILR